MGEENTCDVRIRKFDFGSKYSSSEIELPTSDFLIAPSHHFVRHHRQYDLTHRSLHLFYVGIAI